MIQVKKGADFVHLPSFLAVQCIWEIDVGALARCHREWQELVITNHYRDVADLVIPGDHFPFETMRLVGSRAIFYQVTLQQHPIRIGHLICQISIATTLTLFSVRTTPFLVLVTSSVTTHVR